MVQLLVELLSDPVAKRRWEAALALKEIADPAAATPLVNALEDEDHDVRWVAGKALIALRMAGLRSVLSGLIQRSGSVVFRTSAHHLLHDLMEWLPGCGAGARIACYVSTCRHDSERGLFGHFETGRTSDHSKEIVGPRSQNRPTKPMTIRRAITAIAGLTNEPDLDA